MSKQNNDSFDCKVSFRCDAETNVKLKYVADLQKVTTSDLARTLLKKGLDEVPDLRKHIIDSKYKVLCDNLKANDKLVVVIQDSRVTISYDDYDMEILEPEVGKLYETINLTLFNYNHLVSTLRITENTRVEVNKEGVVFLTFA